MKVRKTKWDTLETKAHKLRKWALLNNHTLLFKVVNPVAVWLNVKRYGPTRTSSNS